MDTTMASGTVATLRPVEVRQCNDGKIRVYSTPLREHCQPRQPKRVKNTKPVFAVGASTWSWQRVVKPTPIEQLRALETGAGC